MFSLIVTIVSIALVAALAVATLYYGSDAAAQGRTAARAAAIVSAGEQVAAGLSVYRLNTGMWPATLETLVTESYLNGLPEIAAADSLSFIASAHAAPAVEGDWLYDPETPHLAYIRPISMEVCAEVNRRVNDRRMVLSVLDPGIKVQCAAGSGDPVVVFRNSGVPLTTPPAVPGAPTVGSGGEFGEVGRVIDTEGEDTSGRCVYACEPGGSGGGEATAETEPDAPAQIAFQSYESIGDFNAYECAKSNPSAQKVDYCNSVPLQGESGLPVFLFSGLGDHSGDYSIRVLTCEPFHRLPAHVSQLVMTLNGTTFDSAQIEDLVGITFTASLTQLYVPPPPHELEPPLQAPTADRYLYLAVYNGSNWDIASDSGPVSTTYQSGVTYNEDGTPVVGELGFCGYNHGSGVEYRGAYRLSLTASRGSDSSSATAYILPEAY